MIAHLFISLSRYHMGELFPNKMVYAKKYESLTVRRQFNPTVFFDEAILEIHPDWKEKNEKMIAATRKYRKIWE